MSPKFLLDVGGQEFKEFRNSRIDHFKAVDLVSEGVDIFDCGWGDAIENKLVKRSERSHREDYDQ